MRLCHCHVCGCFAGALVRYMARICGAENRLARAANIILVWFVFSRQHAARLVRFGAF
jgi:hypothetical protein